MKKKSVYISYADLASDKVMKEPAAGGVEDPELEVLDLGSFAYNTKAERNS